MNDYDTLTGVDRVFVHFDQVDWRSGTYICENEFHVMRDEIQRLRTLPSPRAALPGWPEGLQSERLYKAKCDMEPRNTFGVLIQATVTRA